MTGQKLKGVLPVPVPDAAKAMYRDYPDLAMADKPEVIEWTDELDAMTMRQFFDLKSIWWTDPNPDRTWATPEAVQANGKTYLKGNCNDWAPAMMRRLMVGGIPRAALRLVVCRYAGQPHMVLSITATKGTAILDSISGMQSIGKDALEHYEFIRWEGHNGSWERLKPLDFAELMQAATA